MASNVLSLFADFVLLSHVVFVTFVVFTVPLVFIGKALQWRWVRIMSLRVAHLLAIGVVVVQSWLGIVCPLTTFEMYLRAQAGETAYTGSFIEHWLQQLLYWNAPPWVFLMVYTVFGVVVLLTWFLVKPTALEKSATSK